MANRGKEIDIRNFESNLTSTPWAKKMTINFSFSLDRSVFYSFCHWFSIKFLKRYFVCGFVYISDFTLALNRRHKPFLALLDDRSPYSHFLNRGSKVTYRGSLGKPVVPFVVERRSLVNLCLISLQGGTFSLGYNNGGRHRLDTYPYQ